MRANRASGWGARTSDVVTMAPALIIGLSGRPLVGSRLMALKRSPLGSAPTWSSTPSSPTSVSASASTKGLEIDWMVNGTPASPAV